MNNQAWYRKLHWQILIAMIAGVIAGLIGGPAIVSKVGWLGTLFISLLRMIIVPLIITSIISGVASIGGGRDLGRLFSKTLGYYLLTSALAILAGLLAVNIIKPGVGANIGGALKADLPELSAPSSPVEVILDVVPRNFFEAASESNMLSIIFFCIVFGMALAHLPEEPRTILVKLFDAGFQAMMKLTAGVIMFLPLGVFGLIARLVGESGFASFKALGLYMVTITLSLTVHFFVTLPLILLLLGKIKPQIHFRNMMNALLMAFSTSSSAATLPVTISNVEKRVGVSNRISSFVLPMGATVNMDGTALYECAGALFIAQALGVELTLGAQFVVVLTALLASIGAAAVPSAGLVVIFIVLEAINLRGPEVDVIVGAMLAVDRPLDMYRTSINVFSDSCGAAIIAKSEGEDVDTEVVA
jgi:Na+/H+-dicarboxylate symporter